MPALVYSLQLNMSDLTCKLRSTAVNIKDPRCFLTHMDKEQTCAAISESFVLETRYPMLHVGKINLLPL